MFQALDTFNTAIVSLIYYVMFTTLTIVASIILFKDWDGQSPGNIISEICGFVVVLSGTILLHVTKDFKRSSSFREKSQFVGGSYTPLSPSVSAGLCSGNGECWRHKEEEDEDYSEEACSRNQELYV
ncbi:putative magnesium transporter NIPA6 [Forsythia ovata]|uniref:Probable magnesium transporter n=1 Tax=Forsythia ovata TaxID=205694 RepID=A0ABD1VHD8_9LAMI